MEFNEQTPNHWLPTFPAVAVRILELYTDEDVSIAELSDAIQMDPVLTAQVLHVANSPLYRGKSEISTLQHAISWLGKTEIAGIAFSFKLASFAADSKRIVRYFNDYWRQTFIQGCAMSRLAQLGGQHKDGEAYISGLLMDLGRLLMLDGYPGGYAKIVDESNESRIALHLVEQRTLGINHAKIGRQLIEGMGLPSQFADVAEMHILSAEELEQHRSHDHFSLIASAVVSSAIGDFFCHNNQANSLSTIETVCHDYLKLGEKDVEWLFDSVRQDIDDKASLFSVSVEDMPPVSQLMGHASQQCQPDPALRQSLEPTPESLATENKRLRALVDVLESKVCRDAMTQIYNRDYFVGRFYERIWQVLVAPAPFSLILVDIDDFKSINDNQGHLAGDEAIKWTAKVLSKCFGPEDLVARYGGDEFVALLNLDDVDVLNERMSELCQLVEETAPTSGSNPLSLTISVGAVVCRMETASSSTPVELFDLADRAMYQSKRMGGNRPTIITTDSIPDSWTGMVDESKRASMSIPVDVKLPPAFMASVSGG